ncbi:hypothetical protein AGMMS50225_18880 [Betaproteobacteria bacterium]|nr:hypothetical protein AGMMS50225_18880 [Betaproteobacteria bacterium]
MSILPVDQKVKYGNHTADVSSAAGVRGVLCKSFDGHYFFRVYAKDHSFIDYTLRHDDLQVTIAEDELASFYRVGEEHILDHSPGVLGLENAKTESQSPAQQGTSATG